MSALTDLWALRFSCFSVSIGFQVSAEVREDAAHKMLIGFWE